MKLVILMSFLITSAFAAETSTDCPMMKQQGRGINPKVNLELTKQVKQETKSNVTTGQ